MSGFLQTNTVDERLRKFVSASGWPCEYHTKLFEFENNTHLGFLVSDYLRHVRQSRVVMSTTHTDCRTCLPSASWA